MNTSHDFGAQRLVNRALPGDPTHVAEAGSADPDMEMAFSTVAVPRMTPVFFTFVINFKRLWVKIMLQTVSHQVN